MNYSQLIKAYSKAQSFYLYGEETYFIEDFIAKALAGLNPSFKDFNYDIVDLSTTNYDVSLLRLNTVPMMDSHRLVVLKNFSCRETKDCIWTKEEKEGFSAILKALPSEVKVVIIASSNDKSTKVFKNLSAVVTVFEAVRLDHLNLTAHVQQQSSLHHHPIDRVLAEYYVSICGYLNRDSEKNLNQVNSEVAKLCNFISSGGQLTKEAIEDIVVKTENFNTFAMLDSSLKGDRAKALALYQNLIDNHTHPMMIFSMLCSSVSLLSKCKLLEEKGMGIDMIAKELRENPFRVKSVVSNGRRFNKKTSLNLLNDLNDMDYKYKTGLLGDNVLGHLAIMRICQG